MALPPNYLFVNPKDGRLVSQSYLQVPGGTSTVPSISFITSSDSGFSCDTSGNVSIISNGTEYLTVSSTGTAFTEDIDLASGKVYKINGTQVVGAQVSGWVAPTGTADRTTFATFAGQTISGTYDSNEVQAIDDHVVILSEHLKALIDDLTTHGLIGT